MFKNGSLATDAAESIVGRKSVNTAFGHVRALFSMSNLDEVEKKVLRELSLAKRSWMRRGDAVNCYIAVITMLEKLFGEDYPKIHDIKEKMDNI